MIYRNCFTIKLKNGNMINLKRVAVTGYTGFIGQHLCKKLTEKGFLVFHIGREIKPVECDRVYHLACPSTTKEINENPTKIMDIIMDKTRQAMSICPNALFVNISSKGAEDIHNNSPQNCYNLAKRCMEEYVKYSGVTYKNYRLPSVYGPGMHEDFFIKRCIDGTAYKPIEPNKKHYIVHIDMVVDALINLTELDCEEITLGEIYDQFTSGQRKIYRSN